MALEYIILKLGGSVITRKNSDSPVFKKTLVKNISKEIKIARDNNKNLRLILLHGAGSFGHPLAHEYQLSNQPVTPKRLEGIARTTTSIQKLSAKLSDVLHQNDVSVVPIQTSSIVTTATGKTSVHNMKYINYILNNNGVPLLGGDVIIDDNNYSQIISADKLVKLFAQEYPLSKILLASDVTGVYPSFPPKKSDKIISVLNKSDINTIKNNTNKPSLTKDVTGSMHGKLKELLSLNNHNAYIFDGQQPMNIQAVLRGDQRGTLVQL